MMNKRYFLTSLVISLYCISFFSNAQTCPYTTFKKLYYHNDSTLQPNNSLNNVSLTADNSYLIGGSQVLKAGLDGNTIWDSTLYNAFYGLDPVPYIAPDGSYYILQGNFTLTSISPSESISWQKMVIDTTCYCHQANQIVKTSDGGFIITGYTNVLDTTFYRERIFVVKTNSVGDTMWTKTLGKTPMDNYGYYTQETSDGGFIVITKVQFSVTDIRIGMIKLNNIGQEQWFKTLPYSLFVQAEVFAANTNDNGIAISSSIDSTGGSSVLVKVDETGSEVYHHLFTGVNSGALTVLGDGNLLMGVNDSLVKLNGTSAAIIWTKGYVGKYNEKVPINSVKLSCDNGYVLTGNAAVFKSSSVCCGSTIKYFNFFSYLIKTDSTFADVAMPAGIQEEESVSTVIVYPNPFSTSATISISKDVELKNVALQLFDVLGKEVNTITDIHSHEITIQRKNLVNGIYFYKLINDGREIASGKIVIN